jgi:peptide/nickel transport system substrate-binding protein
VASARQNLLRTALLVITAAAACGRSDAPPARSAAGEPGRGGALVASVRSDASTYNRHAAALAATDLVSLLTQARLVRVNRATDELEPWLAEAWRLEADNLTYTVTLRDGVAFSDGQPLTADDVVFSFKAAYDPSVNSPLATALVVDGQPLAVARVDARTVTIKFPAPFAPGLRVLDSLPIISRHKFEADLNAGTFRDALSPSRPLTDIVGLGPFILKEHAAGQRMVFARNPHYFRRDAAGVQLPYLDSLTLLVIPDQNTEALQLEAGGIDLMSNGDIRPQDHAAFRRLAEQKRLVLTEVGVGLDPDFLSFNLGPARAGRARAAWLARREFRQAISCGVDRQAIVDAVYLGAAVPVHGPVTPGNKRWFAAAAPACPTVDRERARQLLSAAGLTDRDGNGTLEDTHNQPARFAIITQTGHLRERVVSVLQEQLRQLGLAVDVVALDVRGIVSRWEAKDFDAIYFGFQASSTDPALNGDFWFSRGAFHFWNPRQSSPATAWERQVDELMREQAAAPDLDRRQRAFAGVQKIMAEELPSLYFVAPRVTVATSPRVQHLTAALQVPQLLWSADTLASTAR